MNADSLADVPVDDKECLAHFIFTLRYVRKSDWTVQPNALAPFKHTELSVIRHRDLSQDELWNLGEGIAEERSLKEQRPYTTYGRADFLASVVRAQSLDVKPFEPPKNHANVVGWPADKASQMMRALQISIPAIYVSNPEPKVHTGQPVPTPALEQLGSEG